MVIAMYFKANDDSFISFWKSFIFEDFFQEIFGIEHYCY